MAIKVHDIVKLKIGGRKQKFQVLGPHDTITENCYYSMVLAEKPLCYEQTLNIAELNGLVSLSWFLTNAKGETVSDEHTARIYLKPVSFFKK